MDISTEKMQNENGLSVVSPATIQTQSRVFHSGLIDRLFARFAAMYGNRFSDMWAGIDVSDVKKCWSDELRIFTVDQVGAAVGLLSSKNFPPTLPEFLQLCEAAKAKDGRKFKTATPRLGIKDQPADWHSAKALCMELAKVFAEKRPNNDWANRIMQRHEAGEHLPADSMRMAIEAMS